MKLFKNITEDNYMCYHRLGIYNIKEKHFVMNLQYAIESVSLLVMIFVTSKEWVSATTEYISNSVLSALND